MSDNIIRWTHPTTIQLMNGYKYCNNICRAACVFGINYNIEWWKDFITDESNRGNHREDQAVLQILYYKYQEKYNFKIINDHIDFTIYNN